jgi:hypothetical protein
MNESWNGRNEDEVNVGEGIPGQNGALEQQGGPVQSKQKWERRRQEGEAKAAKNTLLSQRVETKAM